MIELAPEDYRALVDQIADRITAEMATAVAPASTPGLAKRIESTLLAPTATASEIDRLCAEAELFGCAAVCVNPIWIARAAARLRSTPVLVATVIGFPLGAGLASVKRFEAAECLKAGADELDMMLNLSALKSGEFDIVRADIAGVTELAHAAGARLKAILETGLLTETETARAAELAIEAGADFLKTSTGFGPCGVTVADVARLRSLAAGHAQIKAAGGIRTRAEALALIQAGADRIGSSTAAVIIDGRGLQRG